MPALRRPESSVREIIYVDFLNTYYPHVSAAMWLELQQTLVPKLLEAVASDQSDLEWMEAGQSWLVSFDDEAAEQLAASLMSNTNLQSLSAEMAPGIMTGVGIRHLARGIASSGVTWLDHSKGDCQPPGGGGAESSWEDVSQAELDAIELLTRANIIRRVAENDPAVIQVDLVSESLDLTSKACDVSAPHSRETPSYGRSTHLDLKSGSISLTLTAWRRAEWRKSNRLITG